MSGNRVICPACGCHLEAVPGAAPGPVACPDCGKRMDLRHHLPPADALEPAPAQVRPVARPRRRRAWALPAVVGCAVGAIVAGLAVVATRPAVVPLPPPAPVEPWDHAHRGELLSLKDAGDAMALRGDWRGAYDAYNRLVSLAVEHGVADPVAAHVVAAARAGQDRVFAALVTPQRPEPATGPAASPPQTAIASAVTLPTAEPRMPFAGVPAATAPAVVDPNAAARLAADTAPPIAHPPPPPRLNAYTLPDAVTDAQIGEAIDRGVTFFRGRFVNGEVVTGLDDARTTITAGRRPSPPPQPQPSDGPELSGGSELGGLPPRPPPGPGRLPRGGFVAPGTSAYDTPGIDALCVYALLHAGQATSVTGLGVNDPFTEQVLDRLKGYALNFTYHRSLRAAALGTYARPQDRAALEDDVGWLVAANRRGAYTYTMPASAAPVAWDNSNSQYGLFGVWSGAQAGVAVPANYWRAVAGHWNASAGPRGTWGYDGPGATLTMTCAGIASLLVSGEYLDANGLLATTADRPSPNPMADAGLARLDVGDNCVNGLFHPDALSAAGGVGYGLYGLERVGLASGFKYFGNHDWYAELARVLIGEQHADGSWGGSPSAVAMPAVGAGPLANRTTAQREIDTAYALLFLARGRHPILYNKLRYNGHWNDRPHDVAHLARFASEQLERPLNWQVVNLRRNWFDWMDSPVLYISGEWPPAMTDADYAALRDFAQGGGLIFTHADGGSAAFTAWVRQMAAKAFPKYELMRVPKGHPLNTVLYRLKNPPPLEAVSNGSRILLVHCPTDVAGGWQLNWSDEKRPDFQLGVNVFVYAAGKTDYKNRLASPYIPAWPGEADVTRSVARLRFAGEWDPEPYAWTRFARYFTWETHAGLDVQTVDLKDLRPGQVPAVFLTGTVRQDFTAAEAAAARAYVEAGGVLVIDACGGQRGFADGVRTTLLPAAFPGVPLAPLPADHPVFVASRPFADDLRQMPLRPFASEQLNVGALPIEGLPFGRGWVLFSRLDLTTGLLGTQSWGILGYDPAHAQALVKNTILWAAARSANIAR